MWKFKDKEVFKIYNKKQCAKIIGLHAYTLSSVISGKHLCSKVVAYSITKFINADAEVTDYFEYVEKGE